MTRKSTGKKRDAARQKNGVDRRQFLRLGGSGIATVVAGSAVTGTPAPAAAAVVPQRFPIVDIAPLSSIEPGAEIAFDYPDESSPAVLLRLGEPAADGIGPNNELIAYSILCTHKGCPVSFRPERKMLICPCHWSTFDPAKSGKQVIGQASQALPRIELRIQNGTVQAVGVDGLIYGRHTNIV